MISVLNTWFVVTIIGWRQSLVDRVILHEKTTVRIKRSYFNLLLQKCVLTTGYLNGVNLTFIF